MNSDNLQNMKSPFEHIKRVDENGKPYWTSRDLCDVLGYSSYQRFSHLLNKCIEIANDKGMKTTDHFNLHVEMVKLGSGAFRNVENFHLSQMACLIVAENADAKKPQVKLARDYFFNTTSTIELFENQINSNVILYKTSHGEVRVEVIFNEETFWMTQKRMADLFGVDVATINYHLQRIYESGELSEKATIRKIPIVQLEGEREVNRQPLFYNLDVIIAVGYRVDSYQATQFRIWSTQILKEYMIKGFALDDDRLKQGKHFGKDYFDDLLDRIREIRTSERRYYQKITDVYAECSADYDSKAETTKLFFKMVQNMMHWAVTHQTAAELIFNRADAEKPYMGLTTWKNAPSGRVQKSDSIVAKNYLSDKEIHSLTLLSNSFLNFAESRASRHLITTMNDWKERLDSFLKLYDYDSLKNAGSVSAEEAQQKAIGEYEKYKLIQDRDFLSDFDKEIKKLRDKGLFDEDF